MQERGNANAQAWNSAIQSAVGEGWQRLGLRQLSGMLVLVYIRTDLLVNMPCRLINQLPTSVAPSLKSSQGTCHCAVFTIHKPLVKVIACIWHNDRPNVFYAGRDTALQSLVPTQSDPHCQKGLRASSTARLTAILWLGTSSGGSQAGSLRMQAHTGEVSTASIACGVLGMGGNKGAVAVSFSLYRRRIAFVCSHFAAHQVNVQWLRHLPGLALRAT